MVSRGLRVVVEYGNIEYSAVSQPPVTLCSFIQRGTVSSIITPQMTRVFPIETRTDPVAFGAIPSSNEIGRIWSGARPSIREDSGGGFKTSADYADAVVSQAESINADLKTELLKFCANL